ncbi:MAG: hypothetical protein WC967_13520 [Balneolaceae bacterium]
MDDIYYRIYLDHTNKIQIVCMQQSDEPDYIAKNFLSNHTFVSEQEAVDYIKKAVIEGKVHGNPIIVHAVYEFLVNNTFTNILD